ncbi:MAG: hypothetical protein ABI373_11020 [Flavobacteriales bacterium]
MKPFRALILIATLGFQLVSQAQSPARMWTLVHSNCLASRMPCMRPAALRDQLVMRVPLVPQVLPEHPVMSGLLDLQVQ